MEMERTQCAHDENELPPRLVFDRGESMTEHAKAKDHTECDARSEARSVAIRTLDALDRPYTYISVYLGARHSLGPNRMK